MIEISTWLFVAVIVVTSFIWLTIGYFVGKLEERCEWNELIHTGKIGKIPAPNRKE